MTTAAQTNVFECASEWYYRLREPEVAPELIIEWQAWLSEDPAHFAAFSEVEELMHVTGKVDHIDWPDDAELLDHEYCQMAGRKSATNSAKTHILVA